MFLISLLRYMSTAMLLMDPSGVGWYWMLARDLDGTRTP